ncbi:MAG: Uma2 family endonuclease [Spirochaetaceae bacterium]|jgi:Uma2 family endonuclease|nr:Uma2 family endonuclease [Spirochaetaceae bacterium]
MAADALNYRFEDQGYTYADWLEFDESVRAELIGGELYMMAPPAANHQDVHRELFGRLFVFLQGKPCKVYSAPFGVRLFPKEDLSDDTVVEPDIVVICDQSKIDKQGCKGAPDLVIEILSPSTVRHDRIVKFQKYLAAGVREYWVADPDNRWIEAHTLQNGGYRTMVYDETAEAPVSVLPGCAIRLSEIFAGTETPAAES